MLEWGLFSLRWYPRPVCRVSFSIPTYIVATLFSFCSRTAGYRFRYPSYLCVYIYYTHPFPSRLMGIVFDTYALSLILKSFYIHIQLMGIVFDTYAWVGFILTKIKSPPRMPGIVFDTQAMCASTLIAHKPALTINGYRFRYPSFLSNHSSYKATPYNWWVSFSIPILEWRFILPKIKFPTHMTGIVFNTHIYCCHLFSYCSRTAGYRFRYPSCVCVYTHCTQPSLHNWWVSFSIPMLEWRLFSQRW